jgi:Lrp/AsnC family transcriptional regulator
MRAVARRDLELDPADIRILRVLQRDASLAVAEVAREAGMSQTPAWRRIKRLKEAGAIRGVVALVDRHAVGLDFVAYAFVKLGLPSRQNMENFDRMVKLWPEVLLCERITGAVDYLLKVVTEDIGAYDRFLRYKLLDNEFVTDVQSRIVVSTIKDTPALPIEEP